MHYVLSSFIIVYDTIEERKLSKSEQIQHRVIGSRLKQDTFQN